MNTQPVLGSGKVLRWLAGLFVLLVAALAVGFVWLPAGKSDFGAAGWWDAICRAAGVPSQWSAPANAVDPRASRVNVLPELARASEGDVGRGGTIAALRCTMCHGARGVSSSDIPNLAGQYPEVVYKQLMDYKGGQRAHSLMQALAATLSEQEIRDVAAFYAQLARPSPNPQEPAPPTLVAVGSPMRGIAPCASCHGGIDQKPGSPWLEGMPQAYVAGQLQAFASGQRRNDPMGVMRNVARQMTAPEIDAVSQFYANRREPFSAARP